MRANCCLSLCFFSGAESEPPFCQPGAGKCSHSPRSKWPRIKALPSVESLGPAPGKPARPPKFDLSAFRSAMPLVHRGNETSKRFLVSLPKAVLQKMSNNLQFIDIYNATIPNARKLRRCYLFLTSSSNIEKSPTVSVSLIFAPNLEKGSGFPGWTSYPMQKAAFLPTAAYCERFTAGCKAAAAAYEAS